MPRDFEARRLAGKKKLLLRNPATLYEATLGDICLAVLEAEPECSDGYDGDIEGDHARFRREVGGLEEWQRLCTIILDGMGVE